MIKKRFDCPIKRANFQGQLRLKQINVNEINKEAEQNKDKNYLLTLESLKNLTVEDIDKLDKNITHIMVKSEEEIKEAERIVKRFKFYEGKKSIESAEDYNFSTHIYTREELKQIVKKIEQIEKGIENYDDFTKLVVIYDRIKKAVKYDNNHNDKKSFDTRSLRGLITGETVCVGYANMLQVILARQGIECSCVRGEYHEWNEVKIGDKLYSVDLTGDASAYHSGKEGIDTMKNFGQNSSEYSSEHPSWNKGQLSYFDLKDVERALNITKLNERKENANSMKFFTREDGTSFAVRYVGSGIGKSVEREWKYYKFIYYDVVDGKIVEGSKRRVNTFLKLQDMSSKLDYVKMLENELSDDRHFSFNRDFGMEMSEFKERYGEKVNNIINDTFSLKNLEKITKINSCWLPDRTEIESHPQDVGTSLKIKDVDENTIIEHFEEEIYDGFGEKILNDKIKEFIVYKEDKTGLSKYIIYSEQDLVQLPDNVLKEITTTEFLEKATLENGGYIGKFNQNGENVFDEELLKEYRSSINLNNETSF